MIGSITSATIGGEPVVLWNEAKQEVTRWDSTCGKYVIVKFPFEYFLYCVKGKMKPISYGSLDEAMQAANVLAKESK